jgi:putative ABC transport system substrate-binding protein
MSHGPNFPSLFRRDAELVDKILRGANSGDIPIEQPTKFELFLNLKTANTLGVTVLPTLLALADQVIEVGRTRCGATTSCSTIAPMVSSSSA